MTADLCPHCQHAWSLHGTATCCEVCGCMWLPPEPPTLPPPPTDRQLLINRIEDAIWQELERQSEEGMGPYVDREMGMVDASGAGLNMTAVAAAVLASIEENDA